MALRLETWDMKRQWTARPVGAVFLLCLLGCLAAPKASVAFEPIELPIALAATDPAQDAAVFLDPQTPRPRVVGVGSHLEGEGWNGELVFVGRDRVQLDADLETEEGRRRVTLEVSLRRSGDRWSEVRVLDLSAEAPVAVARPKRLQGSPSEDESKGRPFRLSKTLGLIPMTSEDGADSAAPAAPPPPGAPTPPNGASAEVVVPPDETGPPEESPPADPEPDS